MSWLLRIFSIIVGAVLAGGALAACGWINDDPLCDEDGNITFCIENDWRLDPEADPDGMLYMFYRRDWNDAQWITIPGRDGGTAKLTSGDYRVAVVSDNDGLRLHDSADFDSVAVMAAGQIIPGGYIPEDGGELTHPGSGYVPPPLTWGCVCDSMTMTPKRLWYRWEDYMRTDGKTLVVMPRRLTPHYTVTVLDIANIEGVRSVMGGLTGMRCGVRLNSGEPCGPPSTLVFSLQMQDIMGTDLLYDELYTFGPMDKSTPVMLNLYFTMRDGKRYIIERDVSRQVHGAADPMHVNIVVYGLTLPDIQDDKYGVDVTVDGWDTHVVEY